MPQFSPLLVRRTLACENSRFSVFFDELASQQPATARDYLVVAPKQRAENLVTGVAVLPICEGKIGLIKIYRHAIQEDSWEIPRGFIEKNERVLASAVRELEEETGLSCGAAEMKPLGLVTPDAGILAARVEIYAALHCRRIQPFTPVEMGHHEFRLFDDSEIGEMITMSKIQDPCTMIAYYRYTPRRELLF